MARKGTTPCINPHPNFTGHLLGCFLPGFCADDVHKVVDREFFKDKMFCLIAQPELRWRCLSSNLFGFF